LALAESIETQAAREGIGSRAARLHTLAASLTERVWRLEGKDQDALQAIELYRAASRSSGGDGACEAALRGAHLAGERAHDASIAYAELHRQKLRFAVTADPDVGATKSCRERIDRGIDLLAAFRPSQRVIDAIEEGLQGEGAIALPHSPGWDAGAALADRPAKIVRIDSWPGNDSARIVVVLDRPAGYRAGDEAAAGSSGARTFLDLDGVDVGAAPEDTRKEGILTRVRSESTNTGSRVLLELDGQAWRRVFHMQEPYRIVVDVTRHPPGSPSRRSRDVSRVVLDPGHGGKDTGAVGPSGVVEKDVTLDIGHRVARVLMMHGLAVLLTRDDDRFISLEERTARANAFSADLFVSIHCNASEGRVRRGVETYVLDTTRDEIAERVAARENETTGASSADLTAMLGSMRLADQAQRSTRFARLLQRSATATLQMKYADTIDGGVHVAGFYVLVGATMPSVLFEVSYISNAVDEQRLGSDDYKQLLADGIANAVKAYREGR
jgi:N-acetylmuramoyl-L-alanine amidase